MKTSVLNIARRTFLPCLLLLLVVMQNARAQLPSKVVSNVFQTYDSRGDIVGSPTTNESLPADQDPQGNWGQIKNGFQLSLRFAKQEFTNGEPVIATVLLRNTSGKPMEYLEVFTEMHPSPIDVFGTKDGKELALNTKTVFNGKSRKKNLNAQSQIKHRVNINSYYDLSHAGEYVFEALYTAVKPGDTNVMHYFVGSRRGGEGVDPDYDLTSGKVSVRIVDK